MAFYPDLSTDCQAGSGEYVRAIGWLGEGHPYATGAVPSEFVAALEDHLHGAWQASRFLGVHACELCQTSHAAARGLLNLWIPSREAVYVAPELILHYVQAHRYRPPDEFIAAVLACPPQFSAEFFDLLRPFLWYWPWADVPDGKPPDVPAIIQFVNQMIFDAVTMGASEIHFTGGAGEDAAVRLRIGTDLRKHKEIPRASFAAVVKRLERMAGFEPGDPQPAQARTFSVAFGWRADLVLRTVPTPSGVDDITVLIVGVKR